MQITTNKKEKGTPEGASASGLEKRADRVSAERNIEKWPAIWQPARANFNPEPRYLEREIELANGRRVNAKVKVGFTDEGVLTTEDQKTYYALVKQWQENDCSDGHIAFSVRKLSRLLQKKGWGTNVIESITHSLRKLRVTPFTWTNSYHDVAVGDTVEEIELFNILSELKIVRRNTDGHITYEGGYYRFNDFIMRNLLARHTKPVLFDTILNFQSEIAQLLYTHIDLILFDKRQYERRTKELFDDLGIKGVAYKHVANRKQKLTKALKELHGVRLTSGWIREARLERTKDGKDYKVIFQKSAGTLRLSRGQRQEENAPRPSVTTETTETPQPLAVRAEDLVRHFHRAFHAVENHNPQSKELNQAISLIATYGTERARYVIDFSRRAADETRYKPQTFGGILQYTSRALAQHERNSRSAERRQQNRLVDDDEARANARQEQQRQILQSLAPEEYQARFERAKRDLFVQLPWIASYEHGVVAEGMIKAAMVDAIEKESDTAAHENSFLSPPDREAQKPCTPDVVASRPIRPSNPS